MSNSFGSRLKEERNRIGFSQDELAQVGGVKKNAQSNYERDQRSPDADYLSDVQSAGIDIYYVLTGKRMDPAEGKYRQVYSSPNDALETVLRVQTKMGVSFSAEELKSTLAFAYTAQADEGELEAFLKAAYTFSGKDMPINLSDKAPEEADSNKH